MPLDSAHRIDLETGPDASIRFSTLVVNAAQVAEIQAIVKRLGVIPVTGMASLVNRLGTDR